MAYQALAIAGVEPVGHNSWEIAANLALYNVISGCALTYSGAAMTVDLALGSITHNGSSVSVSVQASGYTLVSDPSNPRWTWLAINSAGTATIVSGTAAASPSIPSLGDNVAVALVYVQAGLTIASSASYKIDKRIPGASQVFTTAGTNSAATSTTSTSEVDLLTLTVSIAVGKWIDIYGNMRKQALAAQAAGLGLKINSTVVQRAVDAYLIVQSSGSNQAEDGSFEIHIAPRSASTYVNGIWSMSGWCVSSTGASSTTKYAIGPTSTPVAVLPNATYTSIIIRGVNNVASNALEVFGVQVLTR